MEADVSMDGLWKKLASEVKSDHAQILRSCTWISGVICVCVCTPYIYGLIPALWLRLIYLSLVVFVIFRFVRHIYRIHYKRLHGSLPNKGSLSRVWINWVISAWLVFLLFSLLGLMLGLISQSVDSYQDIITYASIILAVLLFPAIAVMLYVPLVAKVKLKSSVPLLTRGMLKLYPLLLLCCIVIVAINFGFTLFIQSIPIMAVISIILSTFLWAVAWEGCLRIYKKQA